MKNPLSKKNNCTQCEAKFSNHDDLVVHVRHEHHKTIVKCQKCGREFIHEKDRLHHARKEHEEDIRIAVQDSMYEALLHELGHALIDMYNIPITGKEEDAVDQLSTIILLTEGQQGVKALYATANWYDYWGSQVTDVGQLPYHDEHSFDKQRFYSILCFVYGSDPETNYDLVNYLPADSDVDRWASLCIWEYDKISNNWNYFLDPLWN